MHKTWVFQLCHVIIPHKTNSFCLIQGQLYRLYYYFSWPWSIIKRYSCTGPLSSLSRLYELLLKHCWLQLLHLEVSTVSSYSLILLLSYSLITFSDIVSLFRGIIFCMAAVFSDIDGQFQMFGKIFHLFHNCTALALADDCTKGSCSCILVMFNIFLIFNFLFTFLLFWN